MSSVALCMEMSLGLEEEGEGGVYPLSCPTGQCSCPTGRIEWRFWTPSSTMTQLTTTLRESRTACWSGASRREEVSGDPGVRGHSAGADYMML